MSTPKKHEPKFVEELKTPEVIVPEVPPAPAAKAKAPAPSVWEAPFPVTGTVQVRFLADVTITGRTFRKGDTHALPAASCHNIAKHITGAH